MAFYSRRGNWGWNPYKKYRYGSKRTKGNLKAAKQTRDAMNVTVKCNTTFMSAYNKASDYGTAVVPVYEILKKSPQFTSFSALYDQVKINGIRCKLSIVDAETSINDLSNLKTINVITGWDRTGISNEQLRFFADLGNPAATPPQPPTLINPDKYDETVVKCFTYKIGKGIVNATGVAKSTINAFTRWSANPYLYPSTTEEKSCYLSTSSFKDFVEAISLTNGYSKLSGEFDGLTVHQLTNASNPCIPFESPICKWKPCLMVGVFRSTISKDDNDVPFIEQFDNCGQILFNAEFSVDVTFRNIKAATREIDTNPPSPEPTPMPVIEDNKTITITNYLDNQIVEPDDGYDALKQVTINVDIQPPAEHNIEEEKLITIRELKAPIDIRPSENYDYMQEVIAGVRINIVGIEAGYFEELIPGFQNYVQNQALFQNSTFRKKHSFIRESIPPWHFRVCVAPFYLRDRGFFYQFFCVFSASATVKYTFDFNYRYIEISLNPNDTRLWPRKHIFITGNGDHTQLNNPYFILNAFEAIKDNSSNSTLPQTGSYTYHRPTYSIPIFENTEDAEEISAFEENNEIDSQIYGFTITDEIYDNTQNESTNIQSQLSTMEIEEEN